MDFEIVIESKEIDALEDLRQWLADDFKVENIFEPTPNAMGLDFAKIRIFLKAVPKKIKALENTLFNWLNLKQVSIVIRNGDKSVELSCPAEKISKNDIHTAIQSVIKGM